jgi:subtilisin family serine protease
MIKYLYIYATVLALLMAGCARELDTQVADEVQEPVQTIVPGQAIVQFDDAMIELIEADLEAGNLVTKSTSLNEIKDVLGIESMTRVFSHGGEFEPRHRAAGLHKWYKVVFSSDVPVTKATADLAEIGGIESVEPVRVKRSTSTFNDPRLKFQWHYINDGTLDSSHKKGADVNVAPVWENYTTGNPDVIVAVVDGGVDATTCAVCKENGADVLVAGSAYFKAADRAAFVKIIQA